MSFFIYQKMMIMNKLKFITVDFAAQMQYFIVRVTNFKPLYLSHFWVKLQSFCSH